MSGQNENINNNLKNIQEEKIFFSGRLFRVRLFSCHKGKQDHPGCLADKILQERMSEEKGYRPRQHHKNRKQKEEKLCQFSKAQA